MILKKSSVGDLLYWQFGVLNFSELGGGAEVIKMFSKPCWNMHVIGKNFLWDKITKRDFTKNDKMREHLTGKKISKIF